ncbi:Rha family transcriptional regulator, partial [Haemophilus influenzae]
MNKLLTITKENASTLTMSSREIAELCEKRHDNVLKLVRELIERGLLKNTTPHSYIHPQNNQRYFEFFSDKRDTLVIVARLSPEFTAAVVDRWQALENQQKPNALIPQSFSEAL